MIVSENMTKKVYKVFEDEMLPDIYETMLRLDIRHVPVTQNGRVLGIISDRDILSCSLKKYGVLEVPNIKACEVMTKNVISCSPADSISKVAGQMIDKKISAITVIGPEGLLKGIITSTDIVALMASDKSIETKKPFPFEYECFDVYTTQIGGIV